MNIQNSTAASLSSTLHLHPFGPDSYREPMPGRSYTSENYRFGFNSPPQLPLVGEAVGGKENYLFNIIIFAQKYLTSLRNNHKVNYGHFKFRT